MLALGEMCFEGTGRVEKGLEVLARCGMCFEGMKAVEKAV